MSTFFSSTNFNHCCRDRLASADWASPLKHRPTTHACVFSCPPWHFLAVHNALRTLASLQYHYTNQPLVTPVASVGSFPWVCLHSSDFVQPIQHLSLRPHRSIKWAYGVLKECHTLHPDDLHGQPACPQVLVVCHEPHFGLLGCPQTGTVDVCYPLTLPAWTPVFTSLHL